MAETSSCTPQTSLLLSTIQSHVPDRTVSKAVVDGPSLCVVGDRLIHDVGRPDLPPTAATAPPSEHSARRRRRADELAGQRYPTAAMSDFPPGDRRAPGDAGPPTAILAIRGFAAVLNSSELAVCRGMTMSEPSPASTAPPPDPEQCTSACRSVCTRVSDISLGHDRAPNEIHQ